MNFFSFSKRGGNVFFGEKKVPDNFRAFSIKNLSAEYFLCIFRVFIKKRQIISKRGGVIFYQKEKFWQIFWGILREKRQIISKIGQPLFGKTQCSAKQGYRRFLGK